MARMIRTSCKSAKWLEDTLEALTHVGCVIVEDMLDRERIETTRKKLYSVRDEIVREIGGQKLEDANELGVLRIMMKFDPYFTTYLRLPEMLSVVDAVVSDTAVLHLQNGFILPSVSESTAAAAFQHSFHRDFPRYLEGYVCSVNILYAIDDFSEANGGTLVVPGTHQKAAPPEREYMERHAIAAECPAGSALIFDSTLWHAAGRNRSGKDRLAINHQFTRSFFKQQIDYVRALGEAALAGEPERSKQLLGYYTRVPTSLHEYYRPEAERLYRKGQG